MQHAKVKSVLLQCMTEPISSIWRIQQTTEQDPSIYAQRKAVTEACEIVNPRDAHIKLNNSQESN